MAPFAVGADGVDWITLDHLCADAYATFDHAAVVPVTQIDDEHFLLELFHGPTLAFKDVALQLVGRLFDHVLAERNERVTIVGATSGDTGSAAIDGVKGCDNVDIVILYPAGRVERRPAPADDHGRCSERPRRGHRRHVRRLSGSRQGDVRRRTVPRRGSAVGGQLDQLGAGDGPDRLLRHRLPSDLAARSRCRSRRATSATCSPAGSPATSGRRSATSSCRRTRNDILSPVHQRARHDHPRGGARRSARAWTSRCRRTSSACCSR